MGYDEYTGVLKCGEETHQSDWKLFLGKSYWALLSVCHTSLAAVSLSPGRPDWSGQTKPTASTICRMHKERE